MKRHRVDRKLSRSTVHNMPICLSQPVDQYEGRLVTELGV